MLQFLKISGLIFFSIFLGCEKEMNSPKINVEKAVFLLKDSVITGVNLMTGEKVEYERFPLTREIEIFKFLDKDELLFNLDTFRLYNETPPSYARKSGSSFPLISFHQDSIRISRHLGGVNLQTWANVYGIKQ